MKSYRKELWFNIPSRRGFVNITSEVEVTLRESGIREGFVLVNAMQSTPALEETRPGTHVLSQETIAVG